ncbi:response regulator transcription factor [Microscilla marina]|uniref:Two-component response regulator n=1 Tax=Microscilla marina ATCC 23134 TaxID=313606 RepID=A1ZQN7_MICM2|nr:response regulator transcription factor [Microscilla marina]EAY27192.1 two-component response regulator [Microscilla marina ATCC 23134]
MITLYLIDDHALVRLGLKKILSRFDEIKILSDFSSAAEALEQLDHVKPDLVLCDISLPEMDGIEFTKKAKSKHPDLKVIMLSSHKEEFYVLKAVEAKADGFLHKDVLENELIEAIKRVNQGGNFYSQDISQIIINSFVNGDKPSIPQLSAREKEVLHFLVEGLSNKEIADKLFISSKTVDNHRANILKKLNLKNNVQLVRFALEHKLV